MARSLLDRPLDEIQRRFIDFGTVLVDLSVNQSNLLGHVKVKNFSFEKTVFARLSFDKWETFDDVFAEFVSSNEEDNSNTFRFQCNLPARHSEAELAVCCAQQNSEMWDNNDGVNYSIRLADLNGSDSVATDSKQNKMKTTTDSVNNEEYPNFSKQIRDDSAPSETQTEEKQKSTKNSLRLLKRPSKNKKADSSSNDPGKQKRKSLRKSIFSVFGSIKSK